MAKRFTDTNKYKKPFVRSLPGAYKLLWDFLYHDCDNSGIWIVDFETAQIYVGKDMIIEEKQALHLFNDNEERIIVLDGGSKWFIPGFIEFQYGHLSQNNKAHAGPISTLKKYDLLNTDLSLKIKIKEPTSPLQGAKYKDKEKDNEMDKDKEKGFGKSENLLDEKFIVPQMCKVWYESFPSYTADKENDFRAMGEVLQFVSRQANLKNNPGTDDQIKILNTLQLIADQVNREPFWVNKPIKSIANNIQEFYNKIKNPVNGKQSTGQQGVSRSEVQAERVRRREERESART